MVLFLLAVPHWNTISLDSSIKLRLLQLHMVWKAVGIWNACSIIPRRCFHTVFAGRMRERTWDFTGWRG